MRLRQITRIAYVALLVLAAATGVSLFLMTRAVDAERLATQRAAEFRQLGLDLANASDFLTNEARRYAVTGAKAHFDNYWREVKETKTRDRVVSRLIELGAPQAELDLIEEAKRNSDALIATEDAAMQAVADGDLARARDLMFGEQYDRDKAIIVAPLSRFQEMMNSRAEDEAAGARQRAQLLEAVAAISVVLLVTLFGGIMYLVLTRRVVQPLGVLTTIVGRLARRDYAVEIAESRHQDELADLTRSLSQFRDGLREAERIAEAQAAERAEKERRNAAVSDLLESFEAEVGNVVQTVSSAASGMQSTAKSMNATADHTSRQAAAVAAASEQASTNVQTVASAAEELSSSVSEISRQVAQSAQVAARAARDAERTNTQVKSLAEAAQKIGEVVKLINDIASQTNLLALNATIEAARAGEAGKGFAVVASEVKTLANETAKATEEITGQINGVQQATLEAVAAIQAIGQTIGEINEIAATIASAVEEQGAATQEIARNVQQAAAGTREVSANIGGVNDAATSTGSAAETVLGAAGQLFDQSMALRGKVETFLAAIKAA
jgi:methyl-accepting chemotaxis protein